MKDLKIIQPYSFPGDGSGFDDDKIAAQKTNDNFQAVKEAIEAIVTGGVVNVTTVNTPTYTLLVDDYILNVIYTATGAVTSLMIPTEQTTEGRVLIVKDAGGSAGTNNITIETEGSEKIDGDFTLVINSDHSAINLYSDGSNWFIF